MRTLAIALSLALSACSLTLQRTDTRTPDCSSSHAWAITDAAGAAAGIGGAVAASTMIDPDERVAGMRVDVLSIVPIMLAAAGYAASAMYGAERAGDCRGARGAASLSP